MQFRPDRLREVREKKGLTQRQLAIRCEVTEFQISRYETGKTEPSLSNLAVLAGQLGVSADYLLNLSNEGEKHFGDTDITEDERIILETYRSEGWPGILRFGADEFSKLAV